MFKLIGFAILVLCSTTLPIRAKDTLPAWKEVPYNCEPGTNCTGATTYTRSTTKFTCNATYEGLDQAIWFYSLKGKKHFSVRIHHGKKVSRNISKKYNLFIKICGHPPFEETSIDEENYMRQMREYDIGK
jgi:hypothetical protein